MLSKAKIKYIRSLERKKNRQRYDKFVAEGTKIISEMLLFPDSKIEMIVAHAEWLENNGHLFSDTHLIEVSEKELKQVSFLESPQGVLAVATPPKYTMNEKMVRKDISLYLDGIRDPGNMGTILRIADWFGIKHVFMGEGTTDPFNSKVVQSSMGAFLRVNCIPLGKEELLDKFKEVRIIGTDMMGKNVFELEQEEKKGIIVIGNEGKGISETLKKAISYWITIPGKGQAESLNAGVATGIICAALRN